jgi:hypothetical protein
MSSSEKTKPERSVRKSATPAEAVEVARRIEAAAMVRREEEKIRADAKARDPGTDWPMWVLSDRTFRVSPDGTEARELQPTGFWSHIDAAFVLLNATKLTEQYQEPKEAFDRTCGQAYARNLGDNVLAEAKELDPGVDWPIRVLEDRIFRISPDGQDARELEPDGFWHIVVAGYVLQHARELPTEPLTSSAKSVKGKPAKVK